MIPLWICACTVSGLMTVPQSIAHTTRRTRTVPAFETSTSATSASQLPKANCSETPRPVPLGNGCPQPALSAARSRTALAIGDRVLLGGCRQLVDEAFGDEDIVRGADTAPECRRNARRLRADIFDVKIRQIVNEIDRAFR